MADLVLPGQSAGGPINSESMPGNYDLTIYRGDAVEFYVLIKDQATGNPVDISAMTPKAQLRTAYDDTYAIDFVCTLTGGPGMVRVFMPTSTTQTLLPSAYIWDLQLTNGSGDNKTYLTGDVTVIKDVTN